MTFSQFKEQLQKAADSRGIKLSFGCPYCGKSFEEDINAARNMIIFPRGYEKVHN